MIEAITNRRSIRKYKDKPVPKDVITEILQAGSFAPHLKIVSHGNLLWQKAMQKQQHVR